MNPASPPAPVRPRRKEVFLRPAVLLMDRLRYPQKFGLISLLFALPLGLILYSFLSEITDRIEFSRKEVHGNAYLRPLRRLLERLPAFGTPSEQAPLPSAIDADFTSLEDVDRRLGERLRSSERFQLLRERWQELKYGFERGRDAEVPALRARVLTDLRALVSHVGDTSNLILDPDLDSYYVMDSVLLKLPKAAELREQAADLGRTVLRGEGGSDARTRLLVLAGLVEANLAETRAGLRVAFRNNPGGLLEPSLGRAIDAYSTSVDQLLARIHRDLLGGAAADPKAFEAALGGAGATGFTLWDRAVDELDGLLEARMAVFREKRSLMTGVAGLAVLVVLYLWIGFYRAVMRTVRSLEEASSRMVGNADPSAQVVLHTRDELGQVAGAFNTVATRLRAEWSQAQEEKGRAVEAESRIRQIVETTLDGVVVTDGAGRIVEWNPQASVIAGWNREEALGQDLVALLVAPRSRREIEQALGRRGGDGETASRRLEISGLRKSGEEFPLEIALVPLRSAKGLSFSVFLRDITERKRMERLKNEFVSTVSHELRTPLTSIRGSLRLITAGYTGQLPPKAKSMIDIAHESCERLVSLVSDILDIEKIESGKLRFDLRPLDLGSVLKKSLSAMLPYAQQFGITLRLDEFGREARIVADGDRLIQVVTNLVSNAVKFSPKGSEVRIAVSGSADRLRVEVRDRGAGIPLEFRARIFQKFAQADGSDGRARQGTGLGLSIAKAIVERLGGRIGFESEIGQGTTFWFELPEERVATAAPSVALPGRPTVLIVEDEPRIAEVLRATCQSAGFNADVASSAGEARRLLESGRYAAMTLDLALPDQDGLTFLRELRRTAVGGALPVVVVSALPKDGIRALDGEAVGVVDWLEKPLDMARFEAVLKGATRSEDGTRPQVLHVEDDPADQALVRELIGGVADVTSCSTRAEAREKLRSKPFDLVVLDEGLPDGSGLGLLSDLRGREGKTVPALVYSGREISETALKGMATALHKARATNEEVLDTVKALLKNPAFAPEHKDAACTAA